MFTSAGWKRQHGDKDMLSNWRSPPRPGAKSSEQGRPYNRRNREVGQRREGVGRARSVRWAAHESWGLKSLGARMRSAVSEGGGNSSLAGRARRVWRSLNGHEGESRTQ